MATFSEFVDNLEQNAEDYVEHEMMHGTRPLSLRSYGRSLEEDHSRVNSQAAIDEEVQGYGNQEVRISMVAVRVCLCDRRGGGPSSVTPVAIEILGFTW